MGYSYLSAYKNKKLSETPNVTLVDNGDAIQGEAIGTVSRGKYIVDLMNETGYDIAILGNHEFDYSISRLKDLISITKAIKRINLLHLNHTRLLIMVLQRLHLLV